MGEQKIYVACLASYNAGTLHGEWIDATLEADEIHEQVTAMLAKSKEPGAEEWAIHDYEGFGAIQLNEYSGFEMVSKLAKALNEQGKAFELFYSNESFDDVDAAVEAFNERYSGEYSSPEDWAENFLEDTGQLAIFPEHMKNYFDFKAYARDAQLGGDMTFLENGHRSVFVFNSF